MRMGGKCGNVSYHFQLFVSSFTTGASLTRAPIFEDVLE